MWRTLGLGLIVMVVFAAAQLGCLYALHTYTINQSFDASADTQGSIDAVAQTGLFLSFGGTVSALAGLGVVLTIVAVRKQTTIRREIALVGVNGRVLAQWLGLTGFLAVMLVVLGWFLGRPPVSPPVVIAYQSAQFLPWLWLTVVILVPLFEEFFFRGFLLFGLMGSRLGRVGAVLLTSLIWTAIHMQYDWFELAGLFVLGVVLGWARIKTGSIFPCLAMHAGFNAASLSVCAYYL